MNKFTLYWRTGDREVIEGETVARAMTAAGYGGGAIGALDFYAYGDNHEYVWDALSHEWVSMTSVVR
jgi:hypothetical protein